LAPGLINTDLSRAPAVAVTGSRGRLGSALVAALASRPVTVVEWPRPDYDLDVPGAAARLMARDRPQIVLHAAAWTDVDGCARAPELAVRRNTDAVAELATVCAASGARLLFVSTNEVFDGGRTDGQGYRETDSPNPVNPYGASKLAGEQTAIDAFNRAGRAENLLIVRTAWLYGPPGNDFPAKIIAAADRLPPGEPVSVVADEIGSPTFSADLAGAILALALDGAHDGVYHLVNAGHASRLDIAREVLARCRPERPTAPISRSQFQRASNTPPWAVLENTRAAALGVSLRPWHEALADYLTSLC